ncbi:DUF6297 family protein [Lentzea pudingi]|uniref:DUF6297 family protein n=1 Tax=Lentzea pudingi TaxID=1789439 RepID=UPI00166C98D6|nr:DUF6297 family protein [Lentzea pudingi]
MTAFAVDRRLRTPMPWRFVVARLYSQLVVFSIIAAVGYGWAYAGLTKTPQAGNAWTALCLSVLGAAVLMKVALAFGPVFVGGDRMFWVLSAPVARGPLLLPRFLGLLAVGAVVGAAWPAAVFGMVGAVVPPLVAAGVGAGAGVAVVAGSVVVQRARLRVQPWLSGLVALAVGALLVPSSWAGGQGGWPVAMAVWVVAIGLVVSAAVAVRHLRRADLAAGAALAGAARVSVNWFDLALFGALLAERRARLLGRVRSSRPRATAPRFLAFAWIDALRLRRTPNAVLLWVALLLVPALVGLAWESAVVPAVHLVAAFLATDRLAAGLKFVCRSPAMRRASGMPDRRLRLAHLVFPAGGAVLWCAVSVAFTPQVSMLNGLISAAGAVAVVYRIATRPPIDYGAAVIDFGLYGPTPLGLMAQFSRGPVLLAVLAVVQMSL